MVKSFILLFFVIAQTGCGGGDNDEPEMWTSSSLTNFGRLPRWSSDGERLLFGDDTPGRAGIYVMDMEGVAVFQSGLPPHNWDYRWSPEGGRYAFTSPAAPEDSLGGVWVVDLETQEATRAFDRGRDVSWCDSGRALCFEVENPVGGVAGIYALTIGDSLLRFIAANGKKPEGRPRSNQIAYADGLIDGRVWIGAGEESILASGPGAHQWRWSADGRFLFVVVNRYTSGSIRGVIWRIDGADPAHRDSLTSFAANLSPSGSGSSVVFARSTGSTWLGIWINRSGEDVQITPYGENPDFHPIQEKIAYNASNGGIRIATRVR